MDRDPILAVQGVTKRFGGLVAVNDVSFSVREGESLGIVGPNGAGKTTLFNVISGFEPPSSGEVVFAGAAITRLPPYTIARRGVVRTFQNLRPVPGLTAMENLVVSGLGTAVFDTGRELAEARHKALQVAERVGLAPWLNRQAVGLPYGVLKRLELGRAIMLNPAVLMLDEPFAGLGGPEAEELLEVITGLKRDIAVLLIIEHKLRMLMRIVERVVVLNFGALIADGTPQEIAGDAAVQEAYLGAKGAARFA